MNFQTDSDIKTDIKFNIAIITEIKIDIEKDLNIDFKDNFQKMDIENKTEMKLENPINFNFNESRTYLELFDTIKIHLETGDEAYSSIQKFKKLIKDHLDPSCLDMDLDNTPIHLDEIDHHLHPQIQEILTDNFALRQKQHQTFGVISELLFKLSKEFPEISQMDIQKHFNDNKIPLYIIPVVPSQTMTMMKYEGKQSFMWGSQVQKYQLSIILTQNKKIIQQNKSSKSSKETLLKYGFDSFDEITEYINKCGFINIIDE